MVTKQHYAHSFFESLNKLTGISMTKLKQYGENNNLFNVLEHPMVLEPNDKQLEKIRKLNEFISSYHVLKMEQENNKITFRSTTGY